MKIEISWKFKQVIYLSPVNKFMNYCMKGRRENVAHPFILPSNEYHMILFFLLFCINDKNRQNCLEYESTLNFLFQNLLLAQVPCKIASTTTTESVVETDSRETTWSRHFLQFAVSEFRKIESQLYSTGKYSLRSENSIPIHLGVSGRSIESTVSPD